MKECEVCGAAFEPRSNRQVYCSTECKPRQTPVPDPKNCVVCGVEFRPKFGNQLTCLSDDCRERWAAGYNERKNEARRGKIEDRACVQCKGTYTPKRSNQLYCSARCSKNANNKRNRTRLPLRSLTCGRCGAEFETWVANQKWCSQKCREAVQSAKYERKMHPRPCEVCGKEFQPRGPLHILCSNECRTIKSRARYRPNVRKEEDAIDRAIVCGAPFTEKEKAVADGNYRFLVVWSDAYRKHEDAHRAIDAPTSMTPRALFARGVGRRQQARLWTGRFTQEFIDR